MYMSGLLAWKSPFLMEAVVKALNISPNDQILELGMGFGEGILNSYNNLRKGNGSVYSVDRWASLFTIAQCRFPEKALEDKQIVYDPKLLPFNNEFFDKVFHVHSSYFWTPDLPATLGEIMRVLKPGGILLSGMHLKKLEVLEKMKLLRRRQFDPARYLCALEPAGFKDVKVILFSYILVLLSRKEQIEKIFQMEYIKGRTSSEYQLITAKKPLQIKDLRDPDVVAAYLESKFLREYFIERSIDDGHSVVDVEKELLSDEFDDIRSVEDSKPTLIGKNKHKEN
ncbi:unnamed protein product [Thelazia callipaeda]|uniref:Methyltransf_11 domain-containing protein n=1 Tax=Thelazia callipaeda TaxID=103827 RepID=A0A158RBX3_THECL|nr:unnamed protein product [Thelazia callipaeda]